MSETFMHIDDLMKQLPEIPPDSIVSRTFYKGEQLKAILFGFAPGQELSEHTASVAAVLHFLAGEAHLELGGAEQQARPGTWVYMPPRLSHSILAKTEVVMLLYMLKTPAG